MDNYLIFFKVNKPFRFKSILAGSDEKKYS
jgi:hypothetical protein